MSIKSPTPAQLRTVADDLGLSLSDDDVAEFGGMMAATLRDYYAPLDALPDNVPEITYPRTPGHRPDADEDPLHAWYVKSTVTGAAGGKLAGKRVVLKDNICLAGVPMMNGASTLEGYVPDVDATVVTRILDAGGEIAGKAHCEYFCFSGGSHTNATGATHNPHKRGYSAGGSSSGCRRVGRGRRNRDGDRRRSGRLDPRAGVVLRHLRHEGDPWPGALYRCDADRTDARPCRSDDGDGRR